MIVPIRLSAGTCLPKVKGRVRRGSGQFSEKLSISRLHCHKTNFILITRKYRQKVKRNGFDAFI